MDDNGSIAFKARYNRNVFIRFMAFGAVVGAVAYKMSLWTAQATLDGAAINLNDLGVTIAKENNE